MEARGLPSHARVRPRDHHPHRAGATPGQALLLDRGPAAAPARLYAHGTPGAVRSDPGSPPRQAKLPPEDPRDGIVASGVGPPSFRRASPGPAVLVPDAKDP